MIENSTINITFKPDLFVVPSGSYNSNVVYGSGVEALQPSYDSVIMRGGEDSLLQTEGYIREDEELCDFEVRIAIDLSLPNPWEQEGELRIRSLPLYVKDNIIIKKLPIAKSGLPIFNNVEILDQLGQNALPIQPNNTLKARLLLGGELALIRQDVQNATTTPLTTQDLTEYFGSVSTLNLVIIVRGYYMSNSVL